MSHHLPATRDDTAALELAPDLRRGLTHRGGNRMQQRIDTRSATNRRAIAAKWGEADEAMICLGLLGGRYIDVSRRLINFGNDALEEQERKEDYDQLGMVVRNAREIV